MPPQTKRPVIITLHQPYASLVSLGLKKFETRHWSTGYQGSLLIHAAKRKIDSDGLALVQSLWDMGIEVPMPGNMPLGCIVAIARLTDCLPMTEALIKEQAELERAVGLWEVGRFALKMDNAIPIEPIPWTSRQGKLLPAPDDIVAKVRQILEGSDRND